MIHIKQIFFIALAFSISCQAAKLQIAQLVQGKAIMRNYPNALPSLLQHLNEKTNFEVDNQPYLIENFEDEAIFRFPFIYVNYADRPKWEFSSLEIKNLKKYLKAGGFIYIDAGINADFLQKDVRHGQHHSFANWSVTPAVGKAFEQVLSDKKFTPLKRSHPIFKAFYSGLPDPSILPDTVRDFVINEKWPDGTYSCVGLKMDGRLCVLATPILAMGWGKNSLGQYTNTISFRIRESSESLNSHLKSALNSGTSYVTIREDGREDRIFCQQDAMPAWTHQADGNWRVFRYYHGREISDFAHRFYTRLGSNIFVYALTH